MDKRLDIKPNTINKSTLYDNFGRVHNYLRISLTDKCNLSCSYCMPSEKGLINFTKNPMSAAEIYEIAKIFVDFGVSKIRLTGGEPLLRPDCQEILESLAKLPSELCITTNGILIDKHIDTFKHLNIRSLNVSLDTLKEDRFLKITNKNHFLKVLSNIHLLLSENFHVKLNMVVMKGINDDEIFEFAKLTKDLPVHVRFIEFMPFHGNEWENGKVFSYKEIISSLEKDFELDKLDDQMHDTAKKYQVKGSKGTIAVISTISTPFCADCNRMRLTADGKMKNCLFSKGEADIIGEFRKGNDIKPMIEQCVKLKFESMGGQNINSLENRSMIQIGG